MDALQSVAASNSLLKSVFHFLISPLWTKLNAFYLDSIMRNTGKKKIADS